MEEKTWNRNPKTREESVLASADFSSFVLHKIQTHRQEDIPVDPHYRTTTGKILSVDHINKTIKDIDDWYEGEAARSGDSYHALPQHSGSKIPPHFYRLDPRARRGFVQELLRLKYCWQKNSEEEE